MKHAGTAIVKHNEGDDFYNILMPNDTFLILVKLLLQLFT
jgi:hypothetical protein